jgi:hypothetical protein
MAGIRDLIQSYAYGGPVRRYDGATGSVVNSTPQPAFSSDKTINDAWNKLAGQTGADITAQRQALANQNAVYQTNQNLGNMYGITQAPAQNQFLTDFNTAVGFDPTTSANLMKGMSDATTMANMNKEIGNSNFHYTGGATAHPEIGYQLNPSETFIKSLIAENTANPGKGSGNAIMNQFVGNSSAVGNPFLGEYTMGGTLGVPVRKDANGNPIQSIGALTSKQLTDQRNGPIPVYRPASQSTNSVGDVFILKDPVLSQENDASGYMRITSGGKEYTIDPKSKRIMGIAPVGTYGRIDSPGNVLSPYGQGPNPYGGSLTLAKGGSVKMPQEYSQGNWKLI